MTNEMMRRFVEARKKYILSSFSALNDKQQEAAMQTEGPLPESALPKTPRLRGFGFTAPGPLRVILIHSIMRRGAEGGQGPAREPVGREII